MKKIGRESEIYTVRRYLEQRGYKVLTTNGFEDTIDLIAMKKEENIGCPGSDFEYARTVPLLIRVRHDIPKCKQDMKMQNDSLNWEIRRFSDACGFTIPMIANVNNDGDVKLYDLIQPCYIHEAKHIQKVQ